MIAHSTLVHNQQRLRHARVVVQMTFGFVRHTVTAADRRSLQRCVGCLSFGLGLVVNTTVDYVPAFFAHALAADTPSEIKTIPLGRANVVTCATVTVQTSTTFDVT